MSGYIEHTGTGVVPLEHSEVLEKAYKLICKCVPEEQEEKDYNMNCLQECLHGYFEHTGTGVVAIVTRRIFPFLRPTS